MSPSIFEAAAELQRRIGAPKGAVNTIAQSVTVPQYIRVLVDPLYWYAVQDIPVEFEGYRVSVERREPNTALYA